MNKLLIKSAKLVAVSSTNNTIVSANLIKLPHSRGHIFSLVRLLGKPDEKRKKIETIIKDHLVRLEQTTTEEANIPRRFEQILSAINEDIHKHILESAKIPLTDIHAIIGVVHKNQVFISGIGNLGAIFMHKTAQARFVIYELDKQFEHDEKTWEKIFVTVLDGELHPGDIFYVATKLPAREISLGELQDILATLPPASALKRIHQHVSIGTAFGGIDFVVQDQTEVGPPKKVNPMNSIEQLGKTKKDTATLLGDQSPDFSNILDKITKPLIKNLSKPGTHGTKNIFGRVITVAIKIIVASYTFVSSLIKKLFTIIFDKQKYESKQISKINSDIKKQNSPLNFVQNSFKKVVQLSTSTKLILVGILGVSIILIVGISVLNSKTSIADEQSAFSTIIARVEEKKNSADASLIYEDKSQARSLLAEAGALLETLNADSSPEKSEIERLRQEINAVFFKLRGVTAPQLQTIAESSVLFSNITEAGGVIFGVTDNQELYKLNELELAWQKVETTNGSIGNFLHSTGEGSNVLFVDSNNRLGRIDTSAKTINPITSGADLLAGIKALTIYNENLYILDTDTEQLIKMRPQGTGFEAGTPWINSKESSLKNAKDVAIDGDIYILTPDRIVRLRSGKEVPFKLDVVDPPLISATNFWTSVNTQSIYILDSVEKRVLVFNKDGQFLAQYVDDAFGEALTVIVREDKRNIIVVTPNKALTFPAVHTLN
ncbi:hypothetical protein COY25_00315 [Candidatus Uhrbacteria bacterium CG_4_10_14_0_2_um_filter_41_7]|uniref:Uncharacterized protein n=1 Tax=Candidatus Uhrbacteria bacterium CG_4_9_14_3_um_filter_41_35 TaxID=1975034 RepID=A0A2M7XFK1_9BACT|nr:MAG: hypothetical protein COV92_01830 [Candidatus Uhrbacteria bacterium CG11_big_fil_rev_8_21_14_0_20_41_9]PIZ55754.1 MAG: hypothetical protein COY25_00315 [Candidatus Uhrbacteria bacterium CG_4_10_14_0_2_um_filter_41_7]PJA46654.1 MAG: hypothetical protein CO173_02705 [Candidatus Uhrbacteria bacterium CG_4_9_14_3_um_filter_41_35]